MSILNLSYPVREIMLCTVSGAVVDTDKRKFVGDIVAVRQPDIGAGLRELKRYLWLRVEGLEESDWGLLEAETDFEKRRFCIHLERLKQFNSNFDPQKAADPDIIYQPFLPVDDDGLFVFDSNPINVLGLIYDKEFGIYL